MIGQPREAQAVWDIWDIVRAIGWTLQASGACSSALQRGQFFQDFIPRLQRKERDGKHGEQGGSERTSTGTLPRSRHGHTASGCHLSNVGTHAPVALERLFQQGPFHLPISDPSTVPAPSRAPRGAGHAPDLQLSSRSQEGTRHHPQLGLRLLLHGLPRTGAPPEFSG